MIYVITAAVLIFGYVAAQNPNCNFVNNVVVGQVYNINNNNSAGDCRYTGICPLGYNCRVDCDLSLALSTNCNEGRLLVSRTGDPTLIEAERYCGTQSVSAVSIAQRISIGLITSREGSVSCKLTSQQAAVVPNDCRCGENKQARIVGGQETGVNEFPMMAGLVDVSIGSIHCGATIISNQHVLSAAHCVTSRNTSALSVMVGAHYIGNNRTGTSYSISRFTVHENYNPDTYANDIAVIGVKSRIQLNDNVQPVCLPFKFQNDDFANSQVTIPGWGLTSLGGQPSNYLRKADVTVTDQITCQVALGASFGGTFGAGFSDRRICTEGNGTAACQFDSGGPLLYTDPATGLLFNIGIISNSDNCASDRPGVNTRVTSYLNWIRQNTNSQFCIK